MRYDPVGKIAEILEKEGLPSYATALREEPLGTEIGIRAFRKVRAERPKDDPLLEAARRMVAEAAARQPELEDELEL